MTHVFSAFALFKLGRLSDLRDESAVATPASASTFSRNFSWSGIIDAAMLSHSSVK